MGEEHGINKLLSRAECRLFRAGEVKFHEKGEDELLMNSPDGAFTVHNVTAAFPLTSPGRMVVLRNDQGEEIGVLNNVHHLDPKSRRLVARQLERSYFMPVIEDIEKVDLQLNIVNWQVVTDRGPRNFQVKSPRKNIRKLSGHRLIIRDVDSNRYEIRNWAALPPKGQKLLEEFL